MDRGACQAIVHQATNSRRRLKRLSMHARQNQAVDVASHEHPLPTALFCIFLSSLRSVFIPTL